MEKNMVIGKVTDIERFRFDTDGKGVSTLVAMNGCRLNCTYCINRKCKDFSYGNKISSAEMAELLMKDALYFCETDGAVVFGGGEPLQQTEFIRDVCERLDGGINIRVETALNVPWENIEYLIDKVDEWIIDIKDIDSQIYESYTGCDNKQVLENLEKLAALAGADRLHVRIPRIKHYNKEKNIEVSVEYIKSRYDIEPEVFDYLIGESVRSKTEPTKSGLFDKLLQPDDKIGDRINYGINYEDIKKYRENKIYRFNIRGISLRGDKDHEWLVATYKDVIMAEWLYRKCGTVEIIKSFVSLLEQYSPEEISHMKWYQGKSLFRKKYFRMLEETPELSYLTVPEIEEGAYPDFMSHIRNPIQIINLHQSEMTTKLRETVWSSTMSYSEPGENIWAKIIKNEKNYSGPMVRDYYLKKTLRIVNEMIRCTRYAINPWKIKHVVDNNIELTKESNPGCMIKVSLTNEVYEEEMRPYD